MKTFIFKGSSDGNFSEIKEEIIGYNCSQFDKPIQYALGNPDGQGVIVTGAYTSDLNDGEGWMIGIEIACAGAGLDGWEFIPNPLRNQLIVIAPEETMIVCINLERR